MKIGYALDTSLAISLILIVVVGIIKIIKIIFWG